MAEILVPEEVQDAVFGELVFGKGNPSNVYDVIHWGSSWVGKVVFDEFPGIEWVFGTEITEFKDWVWAISQITDDANNINSSPLLSAYNAILHGDFSAYRFDSPDYAENTKRHLVLARSIELDHPLTQRDIRSFISADADGPDDDLGKPSENSLRELAKDYLEAWEYLEENPLVDGDCLGCLLDYRRRHPEE